MTLPRVYALFGYWEKNPPAAEAMRLAWLRTEETTSSRGGALPESDAMGAFMGMPGVDGIRWVGPPPMRPADVVRMAEMAAEKDRQHG